MFELLCVTSRTLCRGDFLGQMERVAAARPAGIILREKDLPPPEYKKLAVAVMDLCARHGVPCILHSFVGEALELGAPAIHLPLPALRSLSPAERRACALEAFHAAVQDYRPGYGDWETYLEASIRDRLLAENRQYTSTYFHRSLDSPLAGGDEDGFCLYDTLEAAGDGGVGRLEDRIAAEQFLESLSPQERTLARMLLDGCPLDRIAAVLRLPEAQLVAMGREIGQKRRRFYEMA